MESYKLKSGQTLIIREAVKSDAAEYIEYLDKIGSQSDFLTFGKGELSITASQEESNIEDINNSNNKILILALIDEKIVGGLNFAGGERRRTKHTGEMGITVLKEYWALGIGSKLLEYFINWSKNSEVIRKINLRVRSDNYRAINLYEKFNFVKQGVSTRDFYIDKQFYNAISMGLEID
ncbi:putative acetyltransferase YhhY [Oxobacter pfennigii]|uniref:Putative acetyltransferase YhhY n=1 Tax=Oxobacter pfennigii TaxID=36849 RepID=A0A0N8NSL9_9CLOT|nr:GNAT family N-acetyltransferase [Oxobacter pfennigii]KPU42400.1 putative acetyltransferase YhhY [Oxobacter pfennigii]